MKYSNPYFITGIIALLLIGQSYLASGQTVPIANHVVINEVEINPQGNYAKYPLQWVELYNPTDTSVNIGGWTIGATAGLKQIYTISAGTIIPSHQFIVYSYVPLWFPNAGAIIQLKGSDSTVIDQTPPLTDQQGDNNSWQRIYDGYNTGSQSDWVFKSGTPGSSNGIPPTTTTTTQLTISVSTDKQNYVFGDFANIEGQVSKLVSMQAVSSIPQHVNLVISGPNGFKKTFALYPGNDLKFSTTFKLDKILGFNEGQYSISTSYDIATASSSFSLGSVSFTPPPPEAVPTTMIITTDHSNYTISQPIILQGNVSEVIPLTPVKYKVYDPNNVIVYQGTLFPDSQGRLTTVNPYQGSESTSGLLVNSVNPVYGIYTIDATYGDSSASTTFLLIPVEVQNTPILVTTDKKAYAPGETVVISGSTNFAGLSNIGIQPSLQIIRTSITGSSGTITEGNRGIVPNAASITVSVKVLPNNSFTYKFELPSTSDSLGSYRIIAAIPTGVAKTDFVVVQNPSDYKSIISSSPFSITTDKGSYALGDHIIIFGQILNPIQLSTQNAGATVKIQIFNSTGAPVTSGGSFINNAGVSTSNALYYFAFPDANGNFQVQQTIQTGIYLPGNYTLKASYSNLVTSTTFAVYNALETGSQGNIVVSTDKKVYGVDDTVQLNGKISSSTGTDAYTLTLIKPSGNQITFPLQVNNGLFSWTWTIPKTDTTGSAIITTDRSSSSALDPTITVYGIYRVKINSAHANSDLFFQVSKNPQQNQELSPIVVQTDKTDYLSTDVAKVWGQVIPIQNTATQVTNTVVQVLIYSDNGQQVYRGDANVNQGGQFYVTIPFHPGVWKTGTYKLYVQYFTNKAQTSFKVTDPFTTSSTKLQLFMTTDHEKYIPGQTVLVTGRTSYIISIDNVDLTVGLKNDTSISEGQVMSKKGNVLPKSTVPFDQFGSFSYDYKIPNNTPVGNYIIVAQVPFGAYNTYFEIVNQLPAENIPIGTNETQTTLPTNITQTIIPSTIGPIQKHGVSTNMLVEKIGKISDTVIPIIFAEQSVGNKTYYPRELDGLLRVNPGNENVVSFKITSQDGTCIIGLDENCLITKSTVRSGMLYQTVTINGTNFLVGYSGIGIRLQQFSIIPEGVNDVIPNGEWTVNVIKKDQVTRFYYQVTYIGK